MVEGEVITTMALLLLTVEAMVAVDEVGIWCSS